MPRYDQEEDRSSGDQVRTARRFLTPLDLGPAAISAGHFERQSTEPMRETLGPLGGPGRGRLGVGGVAIQSRSTASATSYPAERPELRFVVRPRAVLPIAPESPELPTPRPVPSLDGLPRPLTPSMSRRLA